VAIHDWKADPTGQIRRNPQDQSNLWLIFAAIRGVAFICVNLRPSAVGLLFCGSGVIFAGEPLYWVFDGCSGGPA
jgi:hypothetical protein